MLFALFFSVGENLERGGDDRGEERAEPNTLDTDVLDLVLDKLMGNVDRLPITFEGVEGLCVNQVIRCTLISIVAL